MFLVLAWTFFCSVLSVRANVLTYDLICFGTNICVCIPFRLIAIKVLDKLLFVWIEDTTVRRVRDHFWFKFHWVFIRNPM